MALEKPPSVASSPFKSKKWDEITKGRNFQAYDIPALTLLCQWYEVIEKCIEDITYDDQIQIAYENNLGDIKAFPQLSAMKQASAEIRALNKQLGIIDSHEIQEQPKKKAKTPIVAIQAGRAKRAANAKNRYRATS